MRFVAGRGAVAELLLAWAPWRKAIGNQLLPRRRGEAVAGQGAAAELHREANKRAQKEKGPEETLISLPSHFYLLPCERATRHATRPNRRSPLACSAGMHCRRSCRWHSPPACSAGAVAAAIMQGLQGRLQQMQELRRALGIRQG